MAHGESVMAGLLGRNASSAPRHRPAPSTSPLARPKPLAPKPLARPKPQGYAGVKARQSGGQRPSGMETNEIRNRFQVGQGSGVAGGMAGAARSCRLLPADRQIRNDRSDL